MTTAGEEEVQPADELGEILASADSVVGKIPGSLQTQLREFFSRQGFGDRVAVTKCPGGSTNIRNRLGQDAILRARDLKILIVQPEDNIETVANWVADAFNAQENRTPPNGPVAFAVRNPNDDVVRVHAIVERRRTTTSKFVAELFDIVPIDPRRVEGLELDSVREELAEAGLVLDPEVVFAAVAAVRSGKHLMLTGPPGTGKTTMALAIANAAWKSAIAGEPLLTTATADWSGVETVGAYRLTREQELAFHPGQFVAAGIDDRWLVVDELNRSDIDKAIGQLFTVLSGHPVVLPFEAATDSALAAQVGLAPRHGSDPSQDSDDDSGAGSVTAEHLPISIVPPGTAAPEGTLPIRLTARWRMIATLNDRDQDLLFTLSEALLRRFAVVEIPALDVATWNTIAQSSGDSGREDWNAALVNGVAKLRGAGRPLGAAMFIDCAKHLREVGELIAQDELDPVAAFSSAWNLYIKPQLRTELGEAAAIDPATLIASPTVLASNEHEEAPSPTNAGQ